MARTHGEKIDELSQTAATLNERVDNLRKEVQQIAREMQAIRETLPPLQTRFAILDEKLKGKEQSF